MEGQEFSYLLWYEFHQFLTVFFDLLSRYHVGIMVSVKDDQYPVCRGISGRTVNFQPIRVSEN